MALTGLFANPLVRRGAGAAVSLAMLTTVTLFGTARLALAQGDAAKAQFIPGGVADGAALYAASLLRIGDREGADLAARRALGASLANPRALRVLGQIRAEEGRQSAAALYGAAGLWGWRDTPSQLWLLRAKLMAGDFPGAFQHADALLRRRQEQPQLFALLSQAAAASPHALAAMLPFFEARPIWRTHFFDNSGLAAVDQKGVRAIILALAATGAPPVDSEIRAAVQNMLSRKDSEDAEAVWARFHPGAPLIQGR